MPFDPAYREEFEAGDLVYGLKEPRAQWLMKHNALLGKNWIDKFSTNKDSASASDALNQEFILNALDHPKYHVAFSGTNSVGTAIANQQGSTQHGWRTKSKAGLNWAISTNRHVHFILDGIVMKDVAEKSNKVGNPDSPVGAAPLGTLQSVKVRTITNAELRWIYRHKDHAETKLLVQFWLKNVPCCPPWYPAWDSGVGKKASGDVAWESYQPKHWVV